MSPAKRRKRSIRRRGATMVEFAIIVPILVLFIFGFFELGQALMIDSVVENAAYEGARRAIVPGATATEVADAATSIATASSLRSVLVETDPSVIRPDTTAVTVTVQAPLSETGLIVGTFLGDATIQREVTMLREAGLRFQFLNTGTTTTTVTTTTRPKGRGGRK